MKTYRELLEYIKKMDDVHLDSPVCICNEDDKYRHVSGVWYADGSESDTPRARKPKKGKLVICVEEAFDEEYAFDEDPTF